MREIERFMREIEKNMLTKGKTLKKGVTSCNDGNGWRDLWS